MSAIRKAGEDAGSKELAAVAMQAAGPMMRECEHHQLCDGALCWIYVFGASSDEQEAAKEAARKAVARRTKAEIELHHVERYLEREYEFDGGYAEMRREAERLRPLAREALLTGGDARGYRRVDRR